MTSRDMYTYQDAGTLGLSPGVEIAGYSVEAIDGGIGKVDEATYDVGSSYIVVDTGPWIFGKKVLLPAGVIDRVPLRRRDGLRQPHEGSDQGLASSSTSRPTATRTTAPRSGAAFAAEGRGYNTD